MSSAHQIVAPVPHVYTRDGELFTNSEDLARFFEKKHKVVLVAVENLHCSEQFRRHNFVPTVITRQIGSLTREIHVVEMTKDGFAFLAMGFTGSAAGRFKEAYIERFRAMEAALRQPAQPVSLDDPATLRHLLLGYTEKVLALEAKVEAAAATIAETKPKAEFYDSYADAEGLFLLSTAAKMLAEPQKRFIDMLKVDHLFYRQGALMPKAEHVRSGLFVVKTRMIDETARAQTYLTPKGVQHFSKMLGRSADLFGRLA